MAIKTAVLGYGLSGSVFHLPFLDHLSQYEVKSILSSQTGKIKSRYPHIQVKSTIESVLNDPEIDLIINTLPNHLHYETTAQCLKAKKHVVVEKPFTVKSNNGIELIKIAKENNRTLSVFHNRRWDFDFLILKDKLSKNQFGNISLFESYFDRFRPTPAEDWRNSNQMGSGVLYDLGPHLIDQALVLFGSPIEIFADLQNQREHSKSIDYFSITLFYDNFRAVLRSSSLIAEPTPSFRIYGEVGCMSFPNFDPQEALLKEEVLPGSSHWESGVLKYLKSYNEKISLRDMSGQMSYYIELAKNLIGRDEIPVSAIDAVNGIRIIEDAIESDHKGLRVPFSPIKIL